MPRANRIPIVLTDKQRDRFWSNVTPADGHKDCWLWNSRVDGFGYGHFKVKKRSLKAHRVSWTIVRGPIPNDKTLDHICRVPRCVNPFHLALVSNKQNILRGTSPTAINALKTHCPRGHELGVPNSRGKRECKLCARPRRPSGDTSTIAIKEIVLRCRSCEQHAVLRSVGQTCGCTCKAGKFATWRGWDIARIVVGTPEGQS